MSSRAASPRSRKAGARGASSPTRSSVSISEQNDTALASTLDFPAAPTAANSVLRSVTYGMWMEVYGQKHKPQRNLLFKADAIARLDVCNVDDAWDDLDVERPPPVVARAEKLYTRPPPPEMRTQQQQQQAQSQPQQQPAQKSAYPFPQLQPSGGGRRAVSQPSVSVDI